MLLSVSVSVRVCERVCVRVCVCVSLTTVIEVISLVLKSYNIAAWSPLAVHT